VTPRTNARIAGFTFLLYIALGLTGLALDRRSAGAEGSGTLLASLAAHEAEARASALLSVAMGFCALALAVTLHALTREEDAELARLAMLCRVGEGLVGLAGLPASLGLLKLATSAAAPDAPDPAAASALGEYLSSTGGGGALVSSILFAAGSTLFCWLFLRARSIPAWLARLGVAASLLLLIALPARLAGVLSGPASGYVWMPMLVFELVFAFWLMARGVAVRRA